MIMKDFVQTIRSQSPMKDFFHVKDRSHHFFVKTLFMLFIVSALIYATYEISVYKP